MKNLKSLSTAEKRKIVEEIIANYKGATIYLDGLAYGELSIKEIDQNEYDRKVAYYNGIKLMVSTALNSMDKELLRLIEKEFINVGYKDWWREYYSNSTFYRHLQKAIDVFMTYCPIW